MSRRSFVLKVGGTSAAGVENQFSYGVNSNWDGAIFEEARLKATGVYRRDMYAANRLRGAFAINDAVAVLENTDGGLDTVMSTRCFDGNAAILFEQDPVTLDVLYTYPYGTFITEQPIVDEGEVTIAMHDMRHVLDRNLVGIRYAGTNSGSPLAGVEGGAEDLKGAPKPLVLGRVFNITPVLVNTTRLIYQVTGVDPSGIGGNVGGVAGGLSGAWSLTVYDMRSPLTAGANYTSQADMEANPPAAGQYRVWPAGGCFRLGSSPAGRVTCDVLNQPVTPTVSNIAGRLMRITHSGRFPVTPTPYLASNPNCGIYLTADTNALDALSQVLGSVNATVVYGQSPGALVPEPEAGRTIQLSLPANSVYATVQNFQKLVLTQTDILEGSVRQVVPSEPERGLPVWRVKLGYKRNYTVMSESDLAGSASAADVEFCKHEYRYVTAEDVTVKTQWANAAEMEVTTLLVDSTAAQAECDRLLTMFKAKRDCFRLMVPIEAIRRQSPTNPRKYHPGWVVNITYPRFGMNAGKDFIVLGMQDNLDTDEVELVVWG